jgi:hypothetical protein
LDHCGVIICTSVKRIIGKLGYTEGAIILDQRALNTALLGPHGLEMLCGRLKATEAAEEAAEHKPMKSWLLAFLEVQPLQA